jgi:hypothetical protein
MKPLVCLLAAVGVCVLAILLFPTHSSTPLHAQIAMDPCAGVTTVESSVVPGSTLAPATEGKPRGVDADPRGRHLDSLWTHRAAASQRVRGIDPPAQTADSQAGEIAIVHDAGDLMTRSNPLDLRDAAIRFTPNASRGYDAAPGPYAFRQPLGDALTLADDDAREVALPFGFTFFGQRYDRVFVNSDGNLTFTEADTASTERSVPRFLSGPPRIAPLFADLDPSTSGRVLAFGDSSALSVTWCGVRAYGLRQAATIQVTLHAGGGIDVHVSSLTSIREAVVGVSPGRTSEFVIADFSRSSGMSGGSSAIGESFTTASGLDVMGVMRRFFSTYPDEYDNVFIFTDEPVLADAFAYELTVSNAISGLGLPTFNYSADYGTAGRLQGICNMDGLAKYPDDPRAKFFGENTTLGIMGQEFAHRWLAFLQFRDHNNRVSQALLGRDTAHWSFFFDSDASVLEGNDILDLGGGAFATQAAVERFSLLDQYAMGLVDRAQVLPFFYVQSPTNVVPPKTAASSPAVGVTFTGIRRNVTIDDVIAAMGPRTPSSADSPREFRQAFIYVVGPARTADPVALEKIDRIRTAWDQFISAATDSRMRVETRLRLSPAPETTSATAATK